MAKIIAVCRSYRRGTRKEAVPEGVLREGYGLAGDAHADSATHRQVSLLAMESINRMRALGLELGPGDFAENLTTEGLDLVSLPVGTRMVVGDNTLLEITQIGKECNTRCAIYRMVSTCIMPEEGVFARVIQGGTVKAGNTVRVLEKEGNG